MTPLFGPKPAPPGIAFGPGYGEHQQGGWRTPPNWGWPRPAWPTDSWGGMGRDPAGWPRGPLDPQQQFSPASGYGPGWAQWLGGFQR